MAAPRQRFKPEQIDNRLREIDGMMTNGKSLLEACKQTRNSDKSCYRRRKI